MATTNQRLVDQIIKAKAKNRLPDAETVYKKRKAQARQTANGGSKK